MEAFFLNNFYGYFIAVVYSDYLSQYYLSQGISSDNSISNKTKNKIITFFKGIYTIFKENFISFNNKGSIAIFC